MYHHFSDKTSVSAKMRQKGGIVSAMNNEERNSYVKEQITETLIKLLNDKNIEDISIRDLCETAQVGRASFYRNYETKEDVLRSHAQKLMKEWTRSVESDPSADISNLFGSLFAHYKDNGQFYTILCRNGMADIILDTIKDKIGITEDMKNSEAYSKAFLAYGIYGWVREWIDRGMKESAEEINTMLSFNRI